MKKAILYTGAFTLVIAVSVFFTNYKNIKGAQNNINNQASSTANTEEKIIDVQTICQYPSLPTGCETVAAVMIMNYLGNNISPTEFAEDCLKTNENFYYNNNMLYGPDPNKVFIGSPFSESSYGCYAPVITEAVNKSRICRAENISGKTLDFICKEYIDKYKPVLIWATIDMEETRISKSWYLSDGSVFNWISPEHCFVLVGYNENEYIFNDPITGSVVRYAKSLSEKRYSELGSQAVYIK